MADSQSNRVEHPVVELRDVTFKVGGKEILSDITWSWRLGRHWAILGRNGAGKTTFLRLVRGDLWPSPDKGSRTYYFNGSTRSSPVIFRQHTGMVSSELLDEYGRRRWNVSAKEVVCTGFGGTTLLYDPPSKETQDRAERAMSVLGVEELGARSFPNLSHGQAKKILLARAIVHKPAFLFLDEPCEGLDPPSRDLVLDVVQRMADSGTQILYAAHRVSELIPAITQELLLDQGRIVRQGRMSNVMGHGRRDERILERSRDSIPSVLYERKGYTYDFLIRIEDTDVWINGKKILDGINWTVKPGENWAVIGDNGSGKTTLLQLLLGDRRPAFGGRISRFGDSDPQSIWEIRRRIGLVSAELQYSQIYAQTGIETVVSGFFGSIGIHAIPTADQVVAARRVIESLGLSSLAERNIQDLSYGQLRRLLIARAMVTAPEVLLMDEAVAGLDSESSVEVLELMNKLAGTGTSLIYVTHHHRDPIPALTHVLELRNGAIAFQGTKRDFENYREGLAGTSARFFKSSR